MFSCLWGIVEDLIFLYLIPEWVFCVGPGLDWIPTTYIGFSCRWEILEDLLFLVLLPEWLVSSVYGVNRFNDTAKECTPFIQNINKMIVGFFKKLATILWDFILLNYFALFSSTSQIPGTQFCLQSAIFCRPSLQAFSPSSPCPKPPGIMVSWEASSLCCNAHAWVNCWHCACANVIRGPAQRTLEETASSLMSEEQHSGLLASTCAL